MGTISKNKDLIKVFYNSNAINDNEAIAYFNSASEQVLALDTANDEITPTQWSELIDGVGKDPIDLINKSHSIFEKGDLVLDADFSKEDWLKIITENPEIVLGVIAIKGEDYLHFKSPKSIIEFIANDSDSKNTNRN